MTDSPRPAAPALGSGAPTVSVVVPTRDRPELLARAVAAILGQEYEGTVECLVVFDRSEPVPVPAPTGPGRTLRLLRNDRAPGLAGARNTGILAAGGELVAFCDDDDEWLPGKLAAQARLLAEYPDTPLVSTGIVVAHDGRDFPRLAPDRPLERADFLRDRIMEVHPSTVLARRAVVLERIGLVDEEIPGGYGEDYEFLLRAADAGPVRAVHQPLVRVLWHARSFFSDRWPMIISALRYLVAKHPDFRADPIGIARIEAQLAFAYAGLGDRHASRRWARQAFRHNPREQRVYAALLAGSGLVRADTLVRLAHRAGRGI
ncbi:glycosyltransferase family A protein [Streptomyces sp. DSM 44917]|uniref:Glycosyltransferase family A protein n=1 Tax=Streptomyces boetiae TaxID=3075541 RepID=A0ABU2L5C7_9ACTN|nr:glycosyltransferase family A protein [Streptomyces sp. DSM 44917]MDT0306766.1 glycosyltransferase family A protein [Streptomyces sp. DSM 44917]